MHTSNRIIQLFKENQASVPFSGSAYVKGKETLVATCFGYANRSEKICNQTDTRFGMASGCKLFTAVAICQLIEQGLFKYDTPVQDIIHLSLPFLSPQVTVHHLLTHSSGIPDYFDEDEMDDFEELWKKRPMYRMNRPLDFLSLFQEKPMMFDAGKQFHYNNAGYILLGMIIEATSGLDFRQYIKKHIFNPSGMTQTGYDRMDHLLPKTALGYIEDPKTASWRTNAYSLPIQGGSDGGAYTTVYDLEKFWNHLFSYQLLGKQFTEKLLTPHIQVDTHLYYGYGLWIAFHNDQVFKYFIFGYDPGVRLSSSVYATSRIQSHLLANSEVNINQYARQIDDIVKSEPALI
ncbi:serine hydrolase [Hazenella sp. IB182353]|uniref:serine hydrolase domain-containing protein n=1 Tax=Polycladospora coralii TaxID=2771432 RepID=UPI00174693C8|nr:serine hydrolase [Polycladospora coralii]MBS7530578.1 serine hydrolase [Polycladospora coralii]